MVRRERDREQEVGEAVRPSEKRRVDRLVVVERHELPLGATRERARNVQGGGGGRAPGDDEGGDRGVAGREGVDLLLEAVDVALGDRRDRARRVRRARKLRLDDEQLVAEPVDQAPQVGEGLRQQRARQPEPGAELVIGAVGADPLRVLRYTRAARETRRSPVSRAGVKTRDVLASGLPGSSSSGELSPWTGQNEMWSTSLCLAS